MDITSFTSYVVSHWMLVLAWVLLDSAQFTDAECSKLTISNAMWQKNRQGTYQKTDSSCSGRNVYEQSGGSNYLYYIQANGGWKGWMIGPSTCVNSGGIAVQDDAGYPEDVTGKWEEVKSGSWYYNINLKVECYRLSGAAIAGIVVGCAIVAAIIIAIIACCCCKNKKNNNTVQAGHTNIAYTHSSSPGYYNGQRTYMQPQQTPGYFMGPPAYNAHGAPMVHSYGPPPAYGSYPGTGAPGQAGANSGAMEGSSAPVRPDSVPPTYTAHPPNGQTDPFGYPTKVGD